MTSGKNIEFRVGVTVLLGAIVMAASLYWLQGYKLERNSQVMLVRFNDVGTLAIGDKVTVSGVHKGKVNSLELMGGGVLVELRIWQDVILKKDAIFTIKNMGVMGERFIAINPGKDSILFNNSTIVEGHYDIGIPEVMGKMGDMITELRSLVASFRVMAADTTLLKFGQTVGNVERLTRTLADYVKRNEGNLNQSADNFLKASSRLSRMLERNAELVDSSATRFDRISVRVESFAIQLDSIALTARSFADAINTGDGTLQMLIEDRRLYDDLRQTADNLDDLILDINENPQKYINLKLEIF